MLWNLLVVSDGTLDALAASGLIKHSKPCLIYQLAGSNLPEGKKRERGRLDWRNGM